ncbi:MAG: hypothetical protein ACRDD7_06295 [Peptostreptococcaceae bacterium]
MKLLNVSTKAINKYKAQCNNSKDSIEMAKLKIQRMAALGKIVYTFSDNKGHMIKQYWDMVLIIKGGCVIDVYRNVHNGIYKADYDKYVKWNEKYGLRSKRRW